MIECVEKCRWGLYGMKKTEQNFKWLINVQLQINDVMIEKLNIIVFYFHFSLSYVVDMGCNWPPEGNPVIWTSITGRSTSKSNIPVALKLTGSRPLSLLENIGKLEHYITEEVPHIILKEHVQFCSALWPVPPKLLEWNIMGEKSPNCI